MSGQQARFLRDDIEPPAYDTLSIAPPAGDFENAHGNGSTYSSRHDAASEKKSLKDKWLQMKEEEKRRKEERVRHVTKAEADRITGLDRLRERQKEEAKKSGTKGLLNLSIFC
ncbi:hypothetical protein BKA67DRAFT_550359 [Truncatella angustata]|uniref:Uncharacterized protein n=1 Tax=Truncatella angustata TaxID=152316 RepID=A0A9P8UZA7_9PEZI|nr:uncharacterized protein BKA67DRAFT_550359 [Truncatella angustata]KAH6661165.1 hypothetical protein BKA67DRAFT_550359 [Truncatella angustata]KAH8194236.1 hypothetical protein TruAng_011595 [Truncatella angustata]